MGVIQTHYGSQIQVLAIGIQQTLTVVKQYANGNAALFLRDATASTYGAYYLNGYIPLNYVIKADGKLYCKKIETGYTLFLFFYHEWTGNKMIS